MYKIQMKKQYLYNPIFIRQNMTNKTKNGKNLQTKYYKNITNMTKILQEKWKKFTKIKL